jgi:hypothetical protein
MMKKHAILSAAIVGFLLAIAVAWQTGLFRLGNNKPSADRKPITGQQLDLMRTALAETENLNPDAAESLWMEVLAQRPEDIDALKNLVITRLSRLDQLRKQLSNTSVSDAEKQAIEATFPAYVMDTREAIEKLRSMADSLGDNPLVVAADWFGGTIDNLEAGSNLSAEARAKMLATAERLALILAANPNATPLVGLIDALTESGSDAIDGVDPALAKRLLGPLVAASEASPRNLFVMNTALRFAFIAKDPKSGPLALKLHELTRPFEELIRKDAFGLNLESIGNEIDTAVKAGDFARGSLLHRQWGNLLRPTEMMKVDRKQANPNVLDFVATGTIDRAARRLAAEAELASSQTPLVFSEPQTIDSGIETPVAIASVDFDLVDQPEIAVVGDDTLALFQRVDNAWVLLARKSVRAGVKGIKQADLFPADASDKLRLKRPTRSTDTEGVSEVDLARLAHSHDAYPGLILWGDQGIQLIRLDGRTDTAMEERLLDVDRETGLSELANVIAVETADIDADGDLDLIVSTKDQGLSIWGNRGNLTFFPVTRFSQPPPIDDPIVAMSIGDLDRDLDIDIATMHRSGQLGWLENLLHLQMRWSAIDGTSLADSEQDSVAGSQVDASSQFGFGVAVVEWDGNVSWDVAYLASGSLGLRRTETTGIGMTRLLENEVRATPTQQQPSDASDVPTYGALLARDLDNDSWTDLITFGAAGMSVVRGGSGKLSELPSVRLSEQPVTAATASDFTGNGKIDFCVVQDGEVRFMENRSDVGHYIDVQMKGIDDNATGRVNHFAIGSTLELRFGNNYRAQVIQDRTTHFGIGDRETADTLRAILTNGITQNVINPPIDSMIIEEQTLKGSCPFLYAWDGEKFVFVTDCLWAAPLGLQYAVGKVVPDRPWEYLKVDGKFLKPRNGKYEIRLTEELWELAYFDHVSLIAVDHPADVEIWTNEKVGPPDTVEPKTFTVRETRDVLSATNSLGDDCTALLAARDEQYVKSFSGRIRQGLCPTHWIELDLGKLDSTDRVLLLLTGWILPTDTSLNIQIDQNPDLPGVEAPSVWIPGLDSEKDAGEKNGGEWICSIPAMGFPGGKTKTIVVDLTGKINAADPRIRVQTSAEIYWDAAKLAVNPPQVDVVSTPLELKSAEVAYRGFSAMLPRTSDQPHRYDYGDVTAEPKWPPLAGYVTREGNCLELLAAWDDSMVVLGSGDEIRLQFAAPSDPLPDGWQRDFILHSVGWDKDADLNTLQGQNVGPLPFRAMTAYPPTLNDFERGDQVEHANAWHLNREQSFRKFWKRTSQTPNAR